MAIFNSYVKLPEGIYWVPPWLWKLPYEPPTSLVSSHMILIPQAPGGAPPKDRRCSSAASISPLSRSIPTTRRAEKWQAAEMDTSPAKPGR